MSLTTARLSQIAWIDLDSGAVHLEPADPELERLFIGGRGLGAAILSRHLADPSNPLSPENPLIFATGSLTGTSWPAGARYHVTFHSPLTGIYGYANAGGFFGPALRHAGYTALVITGRAERPIYLEVTPGSVAIRPADHLWGQAPGRHTKPWPPARHAWPASARPARTAYALLPLSATAAGRRPAAAVGP